MKTLIDTNQAVFGHVLLLLAVLYRDGPDDLPLQCEVLWDFIDFVAEEFQKSSERRSAMPRATGRGKPY